MSDRYLVVRPVVGNTYAAVLASSNLSGWVQLPDRTAGATAFIQTTPVTGVEAEVEGVQLGGSTFVNDPPAPEEPPDEIIEFARLLTMLDGGAPGLVSTDNWRMLHATWSVKTGNPSGEDDDPFYLSHSLTGVRKSDAATVAPVYSQTQWSDDWRGAWPEGVIGYEVEQVELETDFHAPVSEPLSAEFTVTLAPSVDGGSIFPETLWARAVVNTQWGEGDVAWSYAMPVMRLELSVHRKAPTTLVAANDPGFGEVFVSTPEGEDVVLDPPHVGTVTVTDFSHAPPYSGLVGFHQQVGRYPGAADANPAPILNDGQSVRVSANASIEGVYTIRPPRFRWIYPSTGPRRRNFPRDDRRNWPRPKAIQVGNRTAGGYL